MGAGGGYSPAFYEALSLRWSLSLCNIGENAVWKLTVEGTFKERVE